jgi:hypothetical protein
VRRFHFSHPRLLRRLRWHCQPQIMMDSTRLRFDAAETVPCIKLSLEDPAQRDYLFDKSLAHSEAYFLIDTSIKDLAQHDCLFGAIETVLCPLGNLLSSHRHLYQTTQLSFRRCRNSPLATWKPPSSSPTPKTLPNDYLFDAIKTNPCVKHPLGIYSLLIDTYIKDPAGAYLFDIPLRPLRNLPPHRHLHQRPRSTRLPFRR